MKLGWVDLFNGILFGFIAWLTRDAVYDSIIDWLALTIALVVLVCLNRWDAERDS